MSDDLPAVPADAPNVLIVDDTPINLRLLSGMLSAKGLRPRPVTSGKAALSAADIERPDLILMDVGMPEMNGYEACERLKAKASLREVPVLFLSGMAQPEDKIRGFRAGGVDYIAKPFLIEEVDARIAVHLRTLQLQKELRGHNERLEKAVDARTRELDLAYRSLQQLDRMKRDFFLMLAHEMRTPSNGLLGICELVLNHAPDTVEMQGLREGFETSRTRMLKLLDDAQYLLSLDDDKASAKPQSCELQWFVDECAARLSLHLADTAVPRQALIPASAAELAQLVLHVANLSTAFSDQAPRALPSLRLGAHALELSFELPQLCLSQEQCEDFFSIGSNIRSMSRAEALGLAPAIAKRIADRCGGTLQLTSLDRRRGLLFLTLPFC